MLMRKLIVVLLCFFFSAITTKAQEHTYVSITTAYGTAIVKLYNETPNHRDNFIAYTKKGYFDKTMFHRVIKNFVIQGGDPDSFFVAPQQGYYTFGDKRLAPEFNDSIFHKRGILGMGRDENKEQASFFTQLYLVQGKTYTDTQLDQIEQKYRAGKKFPAYQREHYKTIGGLPHLDGHYMVIGEVVKGMEMVDAISDLKTDQNDIPLEKVWMKVKVLKKKAVKKLLATS